MTLTTRVRIDHPVNPMRLFDHVTRVAGGDPHTLTRYTDDDQRGVRNGAGQGLDALMGIEWSEVPTTGDDECPEPAAIVQLTMDTPYACCEVQWEKLLPAVVAWLDDENVPRDRWWFNRESYGTWHPGTVDVVHCGDTELVDTWSVCV